jgi:ABC-type glycerol-3-phosphate transport system substrate-binding protein
LDAETSLGLADAESSWSLYQMGVGYLSPVPAGLFWQTLAAQTANREALPGGAPTETGDTVVIMRVWGLAVVTQDPARREAALGLVRWLVSAQHMADLTYAAALLPTRSSAVDTWPLDPERAAILNDLLDNSVSDLPLAVNGSVRRALQAGLTGLLQEEVDTPEAAASLALTTLRR